MKELAFCWDGGWLVGVDGGIEWSSSDGLMLVRLAVLHKKSIILCPGDSYFCILGHQQRCSVVELCVCMERSEHFLGQEVC